MGVLFENRIVENYSNSFLSILSEVTQNEKEIFSENLFSECNLDIFDESSQILTESLSDLLSKLKKIIMDVIEKIKKIYNIFKMHIKSFIFGANTNHGRFYEDYQITFNNFAKKFKGEFKFRVLRTKLTIDMFKKLDVPFKANLDKLQSYDDGRSDNEINEELKSIENGEYYESILKGIIPGTSKSTFKEDFMNHYFYEEKTYNTLNSEIINDVNNLFSKNGDFIIQDLEMSYREGNEAIKKILNNVSQEKNNESLNSKEVLILEKKTMVLLSIFKLINRTYIDQVKFHISQCRSVFKKVVAFGMMNKKDDNNI